VPDADLDDAASSLARELAAGPTGSLGATKRLFHRGWTETLETQMELETRMLADTARTSDAREGISAFLEKRPPKFSGR
jgi:2-(1,2-epoxy-1,2-dihydrophenyl)acetyl-CoA isomerase